MERIGAAYLPPGSRLDQFNEDMDCMLFNLSIVKIDGRQKTLEEHRA